MPNPALIRTAWERIIDAVDKHNQPGVFTAFHGFEWTSSPDTKNLHRNIIFRDGKEKARQITPISNYDTTDPEDLWKWMADYEENFFGKFSGVEPGTGKIRYDDVVVTDRRPDNNGEITIRHWESTASGLAAVWARENTREALRDARTFQLEDDTWMVLADEAGKERLRAIQMPDDGAPFAAPSTIPEDRPSDTANVFTCTEGPIVTLRFLGPETIRLSVAGEDHMLQRQRSASGARYIGDGIEFWNKGQEVVLFMKKKEYLCTRQH